MSTAFIITIISSLILLALGLTLKIAHLSHRLNLLEKAYNISENEKLKIYKKHQTLIAENSDLENQDVFSSGSHVRERKY